MKVRFTAWINDGHHMTNDWEVPMEITEEEYQRLLKSAKTHSRFVEDDEVRDIYDKAYRTMLEEDLEFMDEEDLIEKMADYLDISEEEAEEREFEDDEILEMLDWEGIRNLGYPVEIQDELEEKDCAEE